MFQRSFLHTILISFNRICSNSEGSIIVDAVLQTEEVIVDEITGANENLREELSSVAPVIGSVTLLVNSKSTKAITTPFFKILT